MTDQEKKDKFDLLYKEYYKLYKMITKKYNNFNNKEDEEDILIGIWHSVWGKIENIENIKDIKYLKTYMSRIAINACLDFNNRAKNKFMHNNKDNLKLDALFYDNLFEDRFINFEEKYGIGVEEKNDDLRNHLLKILEIYPEKYTKVFLLMMEGYSSREISKLRGDKEILVNNLYCKPMTISNIMEEIKQKIKLHYSL